MPSDVKWKLSPISFSGSKSNARWRPRRRRTLRRARTASCWRTLTSRSISIVESKTVTSFSCDHTLFSSSKLWIGQKYLLLQFWGRRKRRILQEVWVKKTKQMKSNIKKPQMCVKANKRLQFLKKLISIEVKKSCFTK